MKRNLTERPLTINLPENLDPLPECPAARVLRERNKKPAFYKTRHPAHCLSARAGRHLTAVNWVKVEPIYNLAAAREVLGAWREIRDPATGYVSWNDLSEKTGRSILEIAQTVKAIQQHYPAAVNLSVNRMGDGVYVKFKPEALPRARAANA